MKRLAVVVLALLLTADLGAAERAIIVGSKGFTESVILGEIVRLGAPEDLAVEHRRQLGGSRILFEALRRGEIDLYPEYSGTLVLELLNSDSLDAAKAQLKDQGLRLSAPLGFNNTYALGVRRERAESLGLIGIGDLREHSELSFAFSNEFMQRADGWPGLQQRYGLPQKTVTGMDHDLAYRALEAGQVDVVDVYSTDADIEYYDLLLLEDNANYFPEYQAYLLYRQDLIERAPAMQSVFENLAGRISSSAMIRMNAAVKLASRSETTVASEFLGRGPVSEAQTRAQRIFARTKEHLALVVISLTAAILIAIPLGVAGWRNPALGQLLLSVSSILQTIPSLALFVFLIPLLGIGAKPAIAALFLYSLLPILRNTHNGLSGIPGELTESARALGLNPGFRLWHIELPLARASIMTGIKIAAVINVGTATLGALIGAGGYGQPILTGIRLDDMALILEGAIPAALLALLFQFGFELLSPRPLGRK
jgi:osmoprotectant transport system permease protein